MKWRQRGATVVVLVAVLACAGCSLPGRGHSAAPNYRNQYLSDAKPYNQAAAQLTASGTTATTEKSVASVLSEFADKLLRQQWPSNAGQDVHSLAVTIDGEAADLHAGSLTQAMSEATQASAETNVVRGDLGLAPTTAAAPTPAPTSAPSSTTTPSSSTTSTPPASTTTSTTSTSTTTVPPSTTTTPPTTTPPPPKTHPAPPATARPAPATPLLDAPGYQGREPTEVDFSGDSSNVITHLTWDWGPTSAVGHGQWLYESCVPNCAQGGSAAYPATLTLSLPAHGVFTKITEQTSGPHGFDRSYSLPSGITGAE